MARASPQLSAFNAGEFTKYLAGRQDIGKYANGCKYLDNYIPVIQGPLVRRGGTRFVAEVKDSNARTWLVKFEFNVQQAYQIEFGNQYLRFYTNRGQLLATGSAAYNAATTYALDAYVTYGGITYRSIQAANTGHQPDISPTWWTAQSIYEITSPYTTADLLSTDNTFNLGFVESNDVVYMCHGSYAPRKLLRNGNIDWSVVTMDQTGGPFKTINTTSTTVYASAATGSVTITASADIFQSGHVGSLFYLQQKSAVDIPQWEAGKSITAGAVRRSDGKNYKALNTATTGGVKPIHTSGAVYDGDTGVQWDFQDPGYGYVKITGYTDARNVTATVVSRIPDDAVGSGQATTLWAHGAWSDVEGWPTHSGFFKERLVFGRGQDFWLSVAGDYENFSSKDDGGVVTTDMAISITVQSDQVNNIQWMYPTDSLIIGTAGGEFAVQPLTPNQAFGADNVTCTRISSYGSRLIPAVQVGDSVLFVQRAGKKVRDLTYDPLTTKFVSKDKTVLSEHITQTGVIQCAYQQEPYSIVWQARNDGKLIGFTFNKEQDVEGWHPHTIGGSGIVECVSTCPAPAGDADDLWMIVKRTINGVTKRYVEYKDYERADNDDPEDAFYVDSGLTLDNKINANLTPGASATTAHATAVPFSVDADVFVSGDVGREIHYRYTTITQDESGIDVTTYVTAKAKITTYTDARNVLCTINAVFPSTAVIAANNWRMTVTTITGLGHVEGATVQVLANGGTHPDCVVSSGAITLSHPASKAQVGFACSSRVQTMRLNAGAQDGTSQGKTARINKAVIRLYQSLGLKFGESFSSLDEVDFRSALMSMDNPPDLFTGDQVLDWPGDYDEHPWLCVEQPYPLPSTIIAIMPTVSVSDRG